jgi:hypothetical protein
LDNIDAQYSLAYESYPSKSMIKYHILSDYIRISDKWGANALLALQSGARKLWNGGYLAMNAWKNPASMSQQKSPRVCTRGLASFPLESLGSSQD